MTGRGRKSARSIADVSQGIILATVEIHVPPERVFRALTTEEVVKWWGHDGAYKTTAWSADLRVGGAWRTEGVGTDGGKFAVEGEYLEIDAPRKIVQTWRPDWDGGATTTLTYRLDGIEGGTRVTVRHEGFGERHASCARHGEGWEMVLGWLGAHLVPPAPEAEARYFVVRLVPPRATFMADMDDAERAMMMAHAAYWREHLEAGRAVVFGPVADPQGPWGLGVIRAADEAAMRGYEAADPAVRAGRGFRYEVLPMLRAVVQT